MSKDTAEKEIMLLREIQGLYREIILRQDLDYYFSKEQELEDLFTSVSNLDQRYARADEREGLLKDIHTLNLEIIQFVQAEKGNMQRSENAMKRYNPSYPHTTSAFFDKKG